MFDEINKLIETNKSYLLSKKGMFNKNNATPILVGRVYMYLYQFFICGYRVETLISEQTKTNQLTGEASIHYSVVRAMIDIDTVVYDSDEFMPRMIVFQMMEALKFLFSVPDNDDFVPKAILEIDANEQKAD